MPHASNPISRALALMDSEVSMDHKRGNAEPVRSLFVSVSSDELPEDVRQDAAVAERHQFFGCVDANERLEFNGLIADRPDFELAHGFQTILDADNLK